ncbi:TPA: glycosyl transferase family 1 [Candidatus Uhrbacteria bacterium]|nr:MAG: hypothetical protein A3D69_02170 [Candidatus Uhrbacteria bacterium RIFCSPHIGHO2_02_FULL_54_11]HBL39878.1 glycosyl transferase family 1 [Candidatus Uhrbacteria bacterium]
MRIAMIGQKGIQTGERGGGVEKHVEAIGKRLVKHGTHDVFVYARRKAMPGKGTKIEGMHIVYLPAIYTKNLETITHTFLSTLHALFGSYDIIHYHGVGPATLAWIPRLLLRRTHIVVTFHSQDRFHAKWSLLARIYLYFGEWAAVHFPHVCIAVSHTLQVFCRERFFREVVYIPNGAEVHKVASHDHLTEFGLETGGYLLNVGRIVAHKGLHDLISAYALLSRTMEKKTLPKLVIVGAPSFTDAYFRDLKRQAAGNSDIRFLGFQKGEKLAQIFAHAKLYVHPSEAEGLPLVVLEAMSYGLPVLVSDIPENLEAIHHAGFSFEKRNVDDLARRLQELLSDEDALALASARSLETVMAYFNWDMIAQHTMEVYRTIRH